jgi:thiamine biosynthesis lipoprotein
VELCVRDLPSAKKLYIPALFVIALFWVQWQTGQSKIPVWRMQGQIMGTTYSFQVVDLKKPEQKEFHQILEQINARLSTYEPQSELMKFNRNQNTSPLQVSSELFKVIQAAQTVSKATQGAFDITVGPLVNAWGFGPNKELKNPSIQEINTLKQNIGYTHLTLSAPTPSLDQQKTMISKGLKTLWCDLSAIAKGYAVDRIAEAFSQKGYQNYWVEIGGEVRAKGVNPDGISWRVGIEKPASEGRRVIYKIISLKDQSLATSGEYRNFYIEETGQRRSHTIDPRTGEPIQHTLASVSVLHPSNMYADAWATALNVLGSEEGLKIANQHQIAAFFLEYSDAQHTQVRPLLSDTMKVYLNR